MIQYDIFWHSAFFPVLSGLKVLHSPPVMKWQRENCDVKFTSPGVNRNDVHLHSLCKGVLAEADSTASRQTPDL